MLTVTISPDGVRELEVDVYADPGRRGRWGGHPDTWEPEEPAEVEVVAVRYLGVETVIELTADELDEVSRMALEDRCHTDY